MDFNALARRASDSIATRQRKSGWLTDDDDTAADTTADETAAGPAGAASRPRRISLVRQVWNDVLDDIFGPKNAGPA